MNHQCLGTRMHTAVPLSCDPDWVEKTMCFRPDEVPPWLRLRDGEFNVAPEISCRLQCNEARHGNCYRLALFGCLHGGEHWTLVHGETGGPTLTGRMGHAWLERDGWVYDPVLDRVWPWKIYARFTGTVSSQRYSCADTWLLAEATGHCGPWPEKSA